MMFSPIIFAAVEPQFPAPITHTILLFSDDKSGFVAFFVDVDFFVVTALAALDPLVMAFFAVVVFVAVMSASASR
jgi:hypothetical protein